MNSSIWHTGIVIHGLGNGRKFGFPTANVLPDSPPGLEKGVYAARVEVDGKRYKGMLYVGTRPTLGLKTVSYEIHIFNLRKKIYDQRIAFSIVAKIRDEKQFQSTEELVRAIEADSAATRMLLRAPEHALARTSHLPAIMTIIEQAKARMGAQHIDQWQDGYPNEEAIIKDIAQQQGHVFLKERQVVAYAAIVSGEDPYYENIDGQWLTNGNYITVHRIAIHNNFLHRGYADHIIHYAEKNAKTQGIPSFRIDTHHDNLFMRNLIRNNGFTYCGIVQVRDGERLAYEKKLS